MSETLPSTRERTTIHKGKHNDWKERIPSQQPQEETELHHPQQPQDLFPKQSLLSRLSFGLPRVAEKWARPALLATQLKPANPQPREAPLRMDGVNTWRKLEMPVKGREGWPGKLIRCGGGPT